jgi:hypothetical protein
MILMFSRASAAVAMQKNQFVVDNAIDGFDVHQLDNGAYIRTLVTKPVVSTRSKQVAFVEHSAAVVGGSDHGQVYVFDRMSGKLLQTLDHQEDGMVQAIAVSIRIREPNSWLILCKTCDIDGTSTVVAGSSGPVGDYTISVWAHENDKGRPLISETTDWTYVAYTAIKCAMCALFLYQNINVSHM